MRLREIVNLVKNSQQLTDLGEKPPKGMLLYGVPGTGKTLLAKAFAHEAQLPFLACSGNDLLDEEFIKKLFARAREYAPALIFIDEIDAVPKRGSGGAYADALVNRLLVEIDGFTSGQNDLFIIAATNRKENIDGAILRSGRIDLHFEVPQLDKGARRWFIEQMLKKPIFDNAIDVNMLVALTAGLSGADLQMVSRESIIYALRESLECISEKVLIDQVNTLKYGQALVLEDNEIRMKATAYHEAGHAVVSKLMLPERKIEQITVVARSNFLGMVSYDSEQQHDYHYDFLFGLTCVALAGRVAQKKQFGQKGLDSGASGDLKQAMQYAWLAIGQWGMDEHLENINVEQLQSLSKQAYFKEEVEASVKAWMKRATEKTEALVEAHWSALEQVALSVLENEVLDEAELLEIMQQNGA
ncbi:MAG: AAA family ATPase [Gammaproteobacteria bacterium]|nr:AAA family ATPase [Gammaproteobacteria bacterium]